MNYCKQVRLKRALYLRVTQVEGSAGVALYLLAAWGGIVFKELWFKNIKINKGRAREVLERSAEEMNNVLTEGDELANLWGVVRGLDLFL